MEVSHIRINIKTMLFVVLVINKYALLIILASLLKSHLGQDAVHKFINSMVKGSKYCSCMMKNDFKKELLMNKEDDENFVSSTKYWICDNTFVKVREH